MFDSLLSLKNLYLERNKLIALDSELFKQNTNLECLNISKNSLWRIDDVLFDKLINLQYLYLDSNRLEIISEKTFRNQKNFRELNLSVNKSINSNIIQLLEKNSKIRYLHLNSLGLNIIDLNNLN
jgi:Leucine-rich repeat (LRR) protein